VCIIDDDAPVREGRAFLLEGEGWRVLTDAAESFLEAAPTAGSVITDVHMPGIDRLRCCASFRPARSRFL
jgi:FixJ family two-component response regulator